MKPDTKQFDNVMPEILVKMNETHAYLSELLLHSRYQMIAYNPYRYQGKNTVTCGRHVICRLWLRDFDDDEYHKFITSQGVTPDVFVTLLTENAKFKGGIC